MSLVPDTVALPFTLKNIFKKSKRRIMKFFVYEFNDVFLEHPKLEN
jgi:hypothetical protein